MVKPLVSILIFQWLKDLMELESLVVIYSKTSTHQMDLLRRFHQSSRTIVGLLLYLISMIFLRGQIFYHLHTLLKVATRLDHSIFAQIVTLGEFLLLTQCMISLLSQLICVLSLLLTWASGWNTLAGNLYLMIGQVNQLEMKTEIFKI